WQPGERVRLCLPMEPQLVEAHPRVEALRGQVAVTRGPILYCLESPDLPEGVRVSEVRLTPAAAFRPMQHAHLLGGVTVLEGHAARVPEGDWSGQLYRPYRRVPPERLPVRLIPYFAWANRGISQMSVWLPLAEA
ncbi:MAG: glycoside hydrolase family 127 protein, partial [Armatimonadota bacterium]|nr:glycoside hydrolase family 127 protein [Armatimonadota bacterium]